MTRSLNIADVCRRQAWQIVAGLPGWEASLAAELSEVLDGVASFHVVRFERSASGVLTLTRWFGAGRAAAERLELATRAHALRHPGVRALVGGQRQVIRLCDVVDLPRFRETPLFTSIHQNPPGTRYVAAARLGLEPECLILLGAHRADREWTPQELELIGHVQQAVSPALTLARELDRIASSMGTRDDLAQLMPQAMGPRDYWPTPREQQVLGFVVLGLTSRQIALRLDITERTVRKHLDSVYTKADVSGRAEAAAWWSRQQATAPEAPPTARTEQ